MTNSTTHSLWNVHFLNQILDSMAEGVFTLDVRGRITSWNRAMGRISGYTPSEALGSTCALLGFSKCLSRVCPRDIKECGILETGHNEAKDCALRHKQGFDIPVIKQARVVCDERDRVIGIVETVTDITELEKARQKAEEANQLLTEHYRLHNLLGQSRAMQEVFHRVRAAAASRVNVLIQGESGTGKEVIANAIHYNSGQADQPLIRVSCSALSESVLESELFGHAKGAFTGAIRDRRGRFEEAHGGSIFLDEIGELSPAIQVKLLRVLQEREVERVGESSPRKVDIRVITATNHDLDGLVAEGRFRQDLFYRLKVFPVTVPPLRHRREDIPLLVDHFIRQQAEFTGKPVHGVQRRAMRLLLEHDWPGNVRELENAVQHAFVLCNRDLICPEDLPGEIRGDSERPVAVAAEARPRKATDTLDREQLERLLRECGWNKAEAARRLNLSRTAVWKYMKRWGIPLRDPGGETG